MYKVVGCDSSMAGCIHREVCSKTVGYLYENEFKCDHYSPYMNDSTILVNIAEKYLCNDKDNNEE
jgi:hypothetical protein